MFSRTSFRKALASIASVAILGSTLGTAVAIGGFLDTNGTDYAQAFSYLQSKSVIHGYADGLGRPNTPLNRVEALKVILEAQGSFANRIAFYTIKTPALPLFTDVDQKQWYAPYLEAGFERGVITGYPDGSFRPGQLLRTEEAITMLMRTFQQAGDAKTARLSAYIENQPNEWYTAHINTAVDKNLVMHKGKLRLNSAITRGQFFDIVYRLHSVIAAGDKVFAGNELGNAQVHVNVPNPIANTAVSGGTGVVTYDNNNLPEKQKLPSNVQLSPKIDHPYASEKYFSISMPSIGVDELTITHPTDAVTKKGVLSVLQQGVGHLFSYPGGEGKIMIYGHSSGYPWDVSEYTKIFRRINELKIGDRVYVTYAGKLHIYEVSREQTINAKDANKAFQDEGIGEELILFTCWPPDSIAQRYLVHAVPVETIAAH